MNRPRKQSRAGATRKDEAYDRTEAARESAGRKFIAAYSYWRVCGNPKCRRERGCAGDACTCFLHCWELLPEQDRTWYRVAIRSRCNGLSDEEAVRAADAAIAPAAGEPFFSETRS